MPQDPQDPGAEPAVTVESMLGPPSADAITKLARGLNALGGAPAVPPATEPGLAEALEAAKRDLVFEAIDGEDNHELAAQAYAVEALDRLVASERLRAEVAASSDGGHEHAITVAALTVAHAVRGSGLEAGHFVGIFDVLLGPLEELGDALEAAGYDLGGPA